MNIIPDILYDSIEEILLSDITYIDSRIFKENVENNVVNDNYYKYLDFLVLKRRPTTNNYIVYQDIFTIPEFRPTVTLPNGPTGSDFMI
jgi:hypothetical protein